MRRFYWYLRFQTFGAVEENEAALADEKKATALVAAEKMSVATVQLTEERKGTAKEKRNSKREKMSGLLK